MPKKGKQEAVKKGEAVVKEVEEDSGPFAELCEKVLQLKEKSEESAEIVDSFNESTRASPQKPR